MQQFQTITAAAMLKAIAVLAFIPVFVFVSMPAIGLSLQIWGYSDAAKIVLGAFFDFLAWTGGLS